MAVSNLSNDCSVALAQFKVFNQVIGFPVIGTLPRHACQLVRLVGMAKAQKFHEGLELDILVRIMEFLIYRCTSELPFVVCRQYVAPAPISP
jgi:hypothetical protein